jgi:hypothetical protein
MKKLIYILIIFIFLIGTASIAAANTYPKNNVIKWKGQTWDIRTEFGEPGPNYFSPSGVYVDNQNRMHLKAFKSGGKWYCSEIDSRTKYKYGTFTCKFASPVFQYNKNVICGMFTYLNDKEELDIELTRWGASGSKTRTVNNIWYSVQPYSVKGNNKGFYSGLSGTETTHVIDWQPTYVRFTSKNSAGKIISDFKYTNAKGIPKNSEYLIFNVWLQGAPTDGKTVDFIISDFKYTPLIN